MCNVCCSLNASLGCGVGGHFPLSLHADEFDVHFSVYVCMLMVSRYIFAISGGVFYALAQVLIPNYGQGTSSLYLPPPSHSHTLLPYSLYSSVLILNTKIFYTYTHYNRNMYYMYLSCFYSNHLR